MRLSIFQVISRLFLVAVSLQAAGNHQVGGHLEMRAIGDIPGRYQITLTNYFEAGPRADAQSGAQLAIYRKRDNAFILTFPVKEVNERTPLVFNNTFCAELRQLTIVVATFSVNLQLDPAQYSDPAGYYISFQSRNRNGGINNIRQPALTGFTYYLDFPPLVQNGKPTRFSSPHFLPINGEYICIGEPFTFSYAAVDPDGDELRYSLATPLNQKTDRSNIAPGPYPTVSWLPGYSATNAIPGYPSLAINPKTGELSITATRAGLFVFSINVEKYRNGKKIGKVNRDFQFLVVDCTPRTLPSPTIEVQNQGPGAKEVTLCGGDSVRIQTTVDTSWNYQWRLNGANISGATKYALTVYEAGTYSVVVSSKKECLKSGISPNFSVNVAAVTGPIRTSGPLCAATGSVRLQVVANSSVRYQWYQNGQPLVNRTTDTVWVNQEGTYWATLTHSTLGCIFQSDTLSLHRLPAIPATIRAVAGSHRLCPQDSLLLESNQGSNYSWLRDGELIPDATAVHYLAKKGGSYVARVTDSAGCQQVSTPFFVEALPPTPVFFDSIPAVCDPGAARLTLKGSPPGGVFAGKGVIENKFDPQLAGIGNHRLTYTVKTTPECAGTVATQTASVGTSLSIDLPDTIVTHKGATITLRPTVTGDTISFQWTPTTYLDNPAIITPSVVTISAPITYTLKASNHTGCSAEDSLYIRLIDRIWVPDAFTPNGDGMNDVLELPGIKAFPDAVLTIYNRWGNVIYRSQKGYPNPFDGTLNGRDLPTGLYAYTLQTGSGIPPASGTILLLRDE